MRALTLLEESVARISLIAGGFGLVAMVSLTVVEFTGRYLFDYALGMSDEFSGYLFVFMTFLGLAYVTKKDAHINVDIVTSRLSQQASSLLRVVTLLLFLVFSVFMTKLGYDYTIVQFIRGAKSSYIWRTPLWIPVMAIAIGFFLMSINLAIKLIRAIQVSRGGGS